MFGYRIDSSPIPTPPPQESPLSRPDWIQYSCYDAKSTWLLYRQVRISICIYISIYLSLSIYLSICVSIYLSGNPYFGFGVDPILVLRRKGHMAALPTGQPFIYWALLRG